MVDSIPTGCEMVGGDRSGDHTAASVGPAVQAVGPFLFEWKTSLRRKMSIYEKTATLAGPEGEKGELKWGVWPT